MLNPKLKSNPPRKNKRNRGNKPIYKYRSLLVAALFSSSSFLPIFPVLAASPTPGTVIDNQATGSFTDPNNNNQEIQIESNVVQVEVAEVAGITISQAALPEEAPSGVSDAGANQGNGEINPDDVIYFTYKITNVGNDPTQFFIPDAPSNITNGTKSGDIQIIEYDPDGSSAVDLTSNNITVPNNGDTTGNLLNGIANTNDGSVPAGGSITIRVPVKADSSLSDGDTVTVIMGDTGSNDNSAATQNQVYAVGTNDVYTEDNPNGTTGETDGTPINGDATNNRQEASASQDVAVAAASNQLVSAPICNPDKAFTTWDGGTPPANGSLVGTSTNLEGNQVTWTSSLTSGSFSSQPRPIYQEFANNLRVTHGGGTSNLEMTFDAPEEDLLLEVADILIGAERVRITGYNGGTEVYPQFVTLSRGATIGGVNNNEVFDVDGDSSDQAAAQYTFPTAVDRVVIENIGTQSFVIYRLYNCQSDFGDAPNTYNTLFANDGARHAVNSNIHLGATVSGDTNGFSDGTDDNLDATDDTDDGVQLNSATLQGQSVTQGDTVDLDITTVGTGVLNAWIDWNGDGDFGDAGEQIATDADVSGGALSVPVPSGATVGTTYARFRYSSDTGLTPTGLASNGEVEDYQIAIAASTPIDKIPDPPPTSTDPTPPEGRICAAPGSDGSISLSGVVNTYHPGAASVSAGNSSITLGAINSNGNTTPISKGDKLLIIQMQDAEINSTNTDAYGNGSPGGAASGSTALNTAGYYQYVVADNDVPTSGGTLQIKESLEYTFTNADATATSGQRRFQVVRLPQHINATISSTVTAAPWNGNSGGIFALDVSNTLTFSGGTIDVNGQGFRGGGGINVNGNNTPLPAPGNTDYVNLSTQPFHGSKGEGIAGTPRLMRNDVTTTVTDNSIEGYPNGSFGRGAPGNAGGGSTDPNQQQNAANTGGGGGANHGYGGHGGDSWTDGYGRQPTGGYGGQAFPTSFNRIIMGGGGGAGTANNSPNGPTPSGGAGGGIVILRAGEITGTGSIETNGIQGVEPEGTDGGGGGGAGGSVMVLSVDPSSASLTINARGGNGLNSGFREHGPGGGGGGGYIAYQGLTPIADVSGGQPGNDKAGGTVNPDPDPYGATAGAEGFAEPATIPDAGVKPGAECHPNLLLVKRITKINDNNFTDYVDEPGNAYDDNTQTVAEPENSDDPPQDTDNKWPTPLTDSLRGVINGGKVEPDDQVEYTIYFLSAGDTEAKSVLFCDRVPGNVSFIPNSFNNVTQATGGLGTADRGIMWLKDGVEQSLTNDKDGDAAQYFPPGVEPSTVYPKIQCDGANTNGAVVVNLSNLPNATAPGTPNTSYGYVRFRGKVK